MMLEALIAILIFSTGILAVVGLQAAMMKGASDARYRAEATFIAQQKLGEIWTNAKKHDALSGYAVAEEDISNLLPAANVWWKLHLRHSAWSLSLSLGNWPMKTYIATVRWHA